MTDKTTKIALPPPRMIRPGDGNRFPRWAVVTAVLLALVIGIGAGGYYGLQYGSGGGSGGGPVLNGEGAQFKQAEISRQLAAARVAVAQGDWFLARELFRKVKELDPENVDALVSLPLIDSHLDTAAGTLVVNTSPKGAAIRIKGFDTRRSPAQFVDIPLGDHELEISLEGYEPVTRSIELKSEDEVSLPLISLVKITGRLEVVSEPRGVEFKLLKANSDDGLKELVEVGKTPATIEKLDPGEYRVLMEVEGWPEYSELIRVKKKS